MVIKDILGFGWSYLHIGPELLFTNVSRLFKGLYSISYALRFIKRRGLLFENVSKKWYFFHFIFYRAIEPMTQIRCATCSRLLSAVTSGSLKTFSFQFLKTNFENSFLCFQICGCERTDSSYEWNLHFVTKYYQWENISNFVVLVG